MSIFEPSPHAWAAPLRSLIRIVTGLVFMSFGTMKVFNMPPSGLPGFPAPLMSELGVAGMLEVCGGSLIVLGLFTRPVAFILAGEMAVAYFQAHAPRSFWPSINLGTPAIMFCLWFLYLAFAGAGPWSLDARIARTRR